MKLLANLEHKTLDSLINQWTVSIILEFHLLAKALFLWLWILKRLSKKCKKNYLCRSKVTQALFCALRINYVFFFQPKYRNGNGESPGKFKWESYFYLMSSVYVNIIVLLLILEYEETNVNHDI